MKKFRFVAYLASVALALIVGYIAGNIKGARVEWFYWQCIQMSYDSAIAKLIQDGKCDEAAKSASHMASLHYRNVAGSSLLHTWVLPVIDVDGDSLLSWRLNDAARQQIERAGEFVKEYEKQSDKSAHPSPTR